MKNTIYFIVTFIVVSGCSIIGKDNPIEGLFEKCLILCSGGVEKESSIGIKLKADMMESVSVGNLDIETRVDLREFVHGYVFEKVPGEDFKEVFELYLEHLDRCLGIKSNMPSELYGLRREVMILWEKWNENVQLLKNPLPVGDVKEYKSIAVSLNSLEDDYEPRFNLRRYQYQAIMYDTAAEIIIRSDDALYFKNHFQDVVSLELNAYDAIDKATIEYNLILKEPNKLSLVEIQILLKQEAEERLSQLKAEICARLVYLGMSNYSIEMEKSLENLTCEYILKYQLNSNPEFTDIETPNAINNCLNSVSKTLSKTHEKIGYKHEIS